VEEGIRVLESRFCRDLDFTSNAVMSHKVCAQRVFVRGDGCMHGDTVEREREREGERERERGMAREREGQTATMKSTDREKGEK